MRARGTRSHGCAFQRNILFACARDTISWYGPTCVTHALLLSVKQSMTKQSANWYCYTSFKKQTRKKSIKNGAWICSLFVLHYVFIFMDKNRSNTNFFYITIMMPCSMKIVHSRLYKMCIDSATVSVFMPHYRDHVEIGLRHSRNNFTSGNITVLGSNIIIMTKFIQNQSLVTAPNPFR